MEEVHNHKKNMDNFIRTITKFFGLDQELVSLSKLNHFLDEEDYKNLIVLSYDCLSLDNFEKYLPDDSFLVRHKFFNITVPKTTEKDLAHTELLNRINSVDDCKAYGVFPFGQGAYTSLDEANRRIVNFSIGKGKRLIYASFNGMYTDDCNGIRKINEDCLKLCEQLDNSVILIISESVSEDIKVPLCVVKRMLSSEKVRMAAMKDLHTINDLIKQSWSKRVNDRPDIFEKRRLFTECEFYNYCSRSRAETCLVYEISEEIVGFILFKINFVTNKDYLRDRSYLFVENIYVKEKYRRRGIGTKLYTEACNYGRKMKIKKVELSVLERETELISFIDSLNMKELSIVYEMDLVDVK